MDYTTQKLAFKVRKALRYVRLYGPQRTLSKVKGQYHMKRRYASLPVIRPAADHRGHVAIIGCGNFAFSNIAYYVKKNYGQVIRAAMDIDVHKAASLYERYGLSYYTDDAAKVLDDPAIDLVYIASNHASHAEYAIAALQRGKSVHIEKPHVVREEQLERLCGAMERSPGRVALGFNRPYSPIGRMIKEHLAREAGPTMFNWFIAGHEIAPEHWYFKEEEGGRVLGNLCHWTDFVFQMMEPKARFPITIEPTRGAKPDCDIAVTYLFGDESIAAITFSAKGHTFEGVRERFAAHRGNVLIAMDDFKQLSIEVVEKKRRSMQLFRDHGHEAAITSSYQMVRPAEGQRPAGCSVDYVWETGMLFLATKTALDTHTTQVIQPFAARRSGSPPPRETPSA
jgi:predicted dehydrogenase